MAADRTPSTNMVLEVERERLGSARIAEDPLSPPDEGEVRMRIERFALTANNVTYGVIGELLGYWDFFPAPQSDAGWGRIPAMGWAEVVASEVEAIEPGGRYYGWYPMAGWCTLTASATEEGLRDDGPHRAEHAPVYRSYLRTDLDPWHEPGDDAEDRHALLRGLFATGYLADDFFADAGYFGAESAVVLSASSKTAIAYAERAARRELTDLIGLTSEANREFVEGLGIYSRVLGYGEEEAIPLTDAVLIDMAGYGEVVERVHARLGERLKHSMAVGMSHHDAPRAQIDDGPQPQLFFAPTQIKQRAAELGRDEYQRLLGEALAEFVGASERWLSLERSAGPEQALAAYRAVHDGKTPPSVGRIVSVHRGR